MKKNYFEEDNELRTEFRKNYREIRIKNNIKYKDIADKIGKTVSLVSGMEAGRKRIQLSDLYKSISSLKASNHEKKKLIQKYLHEEAPDLYRFIKSDFKNLIPINTTTLSDIDEIDTTINESSDIIFIENSKNDNQIIGIKVDTDAFEPKFYQGDIIIIELKEDISSSMNNKIFLIRDKVTNNIGLYKIKLNQKRTDFQSITSTDEKKILEKANSQIYGIVIGKYTKFY